MEFITPLLPFLAEHLGTILGAIAALIGGFVYKDKLNKEDAVASLKTGVVSFYRDNPEIKLALSDGKITKEEWVMIFGKVLPVATTVATRGGAKVLKTWTGPVAEKYIEAVAREIAEEFKDAPEA